MLFGVLAGGLLHLLTGVLLLRNGYAESYLVGISGACLALLLTLTTLSPNDRFRFLPVSGKNLGLGLIIAELLLWFMHPGLGLPVFSHLGEQLVTWGGPGLFRISHACHLGGALGRLLVGPKAACSSFTSRALKRHELIVPKKILDQRVNSADAPPRGGS